MFQFITQEDGYFALTTAGYALLTVLLILAIFAIAFLVDKKQTGKKFSARQLAFSGIALALAFVTSYARFKLPLWGMGGSVTLFSMFFICLIGYWYGIRVGLLAAFAFSVLQFMQDGGSYILTPFQTCCDYFFAFTALGIAGFFKEKRNGLTIGYLAGILVRGLFHTIGGYMYWMSYMPEAFPQSLTVIYPIVYNYSFILAEGVITIAVIHLPPVKKALGNITRLALPENRQVISKISDKIA